MFLVQQEVAHWEACPFPLVEVLPYLGEACPFPLKKAHPCLGVRPCREEGHPFLPCQEGVRPCLVVALPCLAVALPCQEGVLPFQKVVHLFPLDHPWVLPCLVVDLLVPFACQEGVGHPCQRVGEAFPYQTVPLGVPLCPSSSGGHRGVHQVLRDLLCLPGEPLDTLLVVQIQLVWAFRVLLGASSFLARVHLHP